MPQINLSHSIQWLSLEKFNHISSICVSFTRDLCCVGAIWRDLAVKANAPKDSRHLAKRARRKVLVRRDAKICKSSFRPQIRFSGVNIFGDEVYGSTSTEYEYTKIMVAEPEEEEVKDINQESFFSLHFTIYYYAIHRH